MLGKRHEKELLNLVAVGIDRSEHSLLLSCAVDHHNCASALLRFIAGVDAVFVPAKVLNRRVELCVRRLQLQLDVGVPEAAESHEGQLLLRGSNQLALVLLQCLESVLTALDAHAVRVC